MSSEQIYETPEEIRELKILQGDVTEAKIDKINENAWNIRLTDSHLMEKLAKASLKKARSINYAQGIAEAKYLLGVAYGTMGRVDISLEYFLQALEDFEKLLDDKGIIKTELGIGISYYRKHQIYISLTWMSKALKDALDKAEYDLAAKIKMNLIAIYLDTEKYQRAEKLAFELIHYFQQKNIRENLALVYDHLSKVYKHKKEYDTAAEYLNKAMDIAIDFDTKQILGYICVSLGDLYEEQNEEDKAWISYKKGMELLHKAGDLQEEISILLKIVSLFLKKQETDQAKKHWEQAKKLIRKYDKDKRLQTRLLELEAQIREQQGKFQEAVRLYKEVLKLREEMEKENGDQMVFAYEELIRLSELKNLYLLKYSMEYASRLQKLILPWEEDLKELFPRSFAFIKPLDLVSGDFLWFYKDEESGDIWGAVVDATGHGVPAAMLSMIGLKALNDIVIYKKVKEPGKILRALHREIRKMLHQEETDTETFMHRDGMDIGLFRVNPRKGTFQFAGALIGAYVIRKGKLEKIKPNKYPVGGEQNEMIRIYNTHNLFYEKGTKLFVLTDGYIDQIGGPDGKRFGSKRFQELLKENAKKPVEEIGNIIRENYKKWLQNEEQLDDVLVIGIEFE